jgi:hypothetical protein
MIVFAVIARSGNVSGKRYRNLVSRFLFQVSHTMDSSVALSAFISLQDIENSVDKSPVLSLSAGARENGYDTVCLPLTTDKWKRRWADMCLLPHGSTRERDTAAESSAETWRANPRFLRDEVTMVHLGASSHFQSLEI